MEGVLMRNALLLCLAALLWGCSSTGNYGQESPYYRYPGENRLVLNHALEIPANWATARLQAGRVVPFGHVQEHAPHCIFEINTVSEMPQRVEPDTFTIVRVGWQISPIAARSGFVPAFFYADEGSFTQMFYKTIFTLRSERQPGVRQLTCQSDQYAAGIAIPRYLSVPEIRQALGGIFTLELGDTRQRL
jgi:hypothetical protein